MSDIRKTQIDLLIRLARDVYQIEASESDVVEEVVDCGGFRKHLFRLVVGGSEYGESYYYVISGGADLGVINWFRSDYSFLSNFYEAPVTYEGVTYDNSEAAFQAQKCINGEDKLKFVGLDGRRAKALGKRVALRSDWDSVKYDIMREIVYSKFYQNSDLMLRLLATGRAELVEGNTWNDTTWGVSLRSGRGKNWLGKILMEVRDEYQY